MMENSELRLPWERPHEPRVLDKKRQACRGQQVKGVVMKSWACGNPGSEGWVLWPEGSWGALTVHREGILHWIEEIHGMLLSKEEKLSRTLPMKDRWTGWRLSPDKWLLRDPEQPCSSSGFLLLLLLVASCHLAGPEPLIELGCRTCCWGSTGPRTAFQDLPQLFR